MSSFNLNILVGCFIIKIIIFPSSDFFILLIIDSLSSMLLKVLSIFISIFDSEKTLIIFDKQVNKFVKGILKSCHGYKLKWYEGKEYDVKGG